MYTYILIKKLCVSGVSSHQSYSHYLRLWFHSYTCTPQTKLKKWPRFQFQFLIAITQILFYKILVRRNRVCVGGGGGGVYSLHPPPPRKIFVNFYFWWIEKSEK